MVNLQREVSEREVFTTAGQLFIAHGRALAQLVDDLHINFIALLLLQICNTDDRRSKAGLHCAFLVRVYGLCRFLLFSQHVHE
ncbi:hypothetical protein D3C81_1570980 [compost metagenome]